MSQAERQRWAAEALGVLAAGDRYLRSGAWRSPLVLRRGDPRLAGARRPQLAVPLRRPEARRAVRRRAAGPRRTRARAPSGGDGPGHAGPADPGRHPHHASPCARRPLAARWPVPEGR